MKEEEKKVGRRRIRRRGRWRERVWNATIAFVQSRIEQDEECQTDRQTFVALHGCVVAGWLT